MIRRASTILGAMLAATTLASAVPAHADTLVDNIDGIRFERDGTVERFAAMLIDDDGKVEKLYRRGEKLPRDADYRIDGRGRVLLPGFIDAHVHVSDLGFSALTLDLSESTSLADAQRRIAEYATLYPDRRWIIGGGWNQEKWGLGRFPTAAEIDAVVADRPVWLLHADRHAGWANTAALAEAGVAAATADPAGGRIERIAGGSAPAGVLVDAAMPLVGRLVPAPRPVDRDVALVKAQELLLERGITAVADMGTTLADWQSYRRAGDLGSLRLRIVAYADGVDDMVTIAGPGPTPWLYDDRLRLAGVKLVLDGSMGSRGAWLKEPYADAPGQNGLQLLNGTQLRNLMSRAAKDKFQVAVHAIGDAANSEVMDAVSELAETYTGDRRWRIEHARLLDLAELPRMKSLGIVASMQPYHMISGRTMAEARLGPARLAGAYAWNSVLAAGIPLAFGSDAPVETPDVFAGIAAAISRRDAAGQPAGGWQPQQAIDRQSALAAYTAGAAWAGQAEGRFGSLAEGERADFIFVTGDPLLASPDEIRRIRVLETYVGGARAWRAGEQREDRRNGR